MDNKRLLIAAILSLGVMIAWSYFFPPPEPQQPLEEPPPRIERPAETTPSPPPEPSTESESAPVAAREDISSEPTDEATPQPVESIAATIEQQIVVEGDRFRAELTNRGAQLV